LGFNGWRKRGSRKRIKEKEVWASVAGGGRGGGGGE